MLDPSTSEHDPIARDVILVVEDERPNLILLKAVVRRATSRRVRDAILLEATTLAEARTIIQTRRIDLIVLDVRLPDGNGLSLARDLKDTEGRPRILVLTASVLPSERATALAAGTDAFMAKPFVPAEVVEAMAGLLDLGPVVKSAGWL
jgi:two-component system, OmpR family, KDP operon response regulator KdpE